MIIKMQLPLATTQETARALAYNEDRTWERFIDLDQDILKLMGGRPRAFFEVAVRGDQIRFIKEVPDPGWPNIFKVTVKTHETS